MIFARVLMVLGFALGMAAAALLIEQGFGWLRFGEFSARDGFWLLSPTQCLATGLEDLGWAGKENCRIDNFVVSEYVGLNKIINYVLEWNLGIVGFFMSYWLVFTGDAELESQIRLQRAENRDYDDQ